MKKYIILLFLFVSLVSFAEPPPTVFVGNLPQNDQALVEAINQLGFIATEQVNLLNKIVFLEQSIVVSLGFIWGCLSIQMYISAKNQRSLI